MGFPSRIGIATGGYRTGSSSPGKVCIATDGYRCPEQAPAPTPPKRGGGHGGALAVTRPPEPVLPESEDETLAVLAIIAIQEMYE